MKYLLSCLIFGLSLTNTFAQNNLTLSEKEFIYLQDKVREQTNGNIDSAFIYADRIEKSNSFYHKTFAVGAKSYLFQINGDSINSNKYFEKAVFYFSKTPNSIEKKRLNTFLYTYRGLTFWKRGRLNDALNEYQKGKKIAVSIGDKIQTIKFNNNIAKIYTNVGNYKSAITSSKESDNLTNKIESLYTKDQFNRSKSSINLNLGNSYEKLYLQKRDMAKYLDSAAFYYKKSILFSSKQVYSKIIAQINLASIYHLQKKYKDSEKLHLSSLVTAKENNMSSTYCNISYNIGDLYFTLKDYRKSLIYLKNVDSIYKKDKTNILEYINSNYYQARIYDLLNDNENASLHSSIYLNLFEKNEQENQVEALKVNHNLLSLKAADEIKIINKKYASKELNFKLAVSLVLLLIFVLLFLYLKNNKEKKAANKKVEALVEEFKKKKENNINTDNKATATSLTLDDEKEKIIIQKLIKLEENLFFLNHDFNLQTVSKKIKTNTTYLSHVVNKNFGKTFSEYSNELKINYVIDELINNPVYRKYSTQAIAESVGFKNAISFSKSFSKRTGVTPIQFTKRLDLK